MQSPVAFSGTREPRLVPVHQLNLYLEAVRACAQRGVTVQVGGSPGLEQTAAKAALAEGGTVRLFLPRLHFEATWVDGLRRAHGDRVLVTTYDPVEHASWTAVAQDVHRRTSPAVTALAARMCGCLEGCEVLFALPFVRVHRRPPGQGWLASLFGKNGDGEPAIVDRGGTGHVIRIAEHMGIRVIDFSVEEDQDQAREWLGLSISEASERHADKGSDGDAR